MVASSSVHRNEHLMTHHGLFGIHTPRKPWVLWVVSNLSLIAAVPLYALWLRRVLAQPALPPAARDGGDVPTVAIFGVALIIACAIPLVNIGLYFLLRRYPGSTPLLPPLEPRMVVELIYLLGVGLLALGVINTLWAGDLEITLVLGVWFVLLVHFRAVSHGKRAIEQRRRSDGHSPTESQDPHP